MKSLPKVEMGKGMALSLQGVEKSFGKGESFTPVLRKTVFDVKLGELHLLVGPSGCGKTTLLSILTGTLVSEAGNINVLGYQIDKMSPEERTLFRAKHLGFIFQQFNLIQSLTVLENVSVPLLIQGCSHSKAEAKARSILARVGLESKCKERPNTLSGGQQQRVAIARAIIHEPPLIVCDEPTSALDRVTGHHIMELLRSIACEPGRAVVVVTHDPRIYHFGDRMSEMDDGQITRVLHSRDEIIRTHGLD